eukprot:5547878-Pleurochrysis_carterae.AAC.1
MVPLHYTRLPRLAHIASPRPPESPRCVAHRGGHSGQCGVRRIVRAHERASLHLLLLHVGCCMHEDVAPQQVLVSQSCGRQVLRVPVERRYVRLVWQLELDPKLLERGAHLHRRRRTHALPRGGHEHRTEHAQRPALSVWHQSCQLLPVDAKSAIMRRSEWREIRIASGCSDRCATLDACSTHNPCSSCHVNQRV